MWKKVIVLFVIALLVSCSVQHKISRKYEGEGREALLLDFGEPQKIVDLANGMQRFIYVKEKYVRETEIGTGRGTLDPKISPGYIKEETYQFDINQQGIIVEANYEKKLK